MGNNVRTFEEELSSIIKICDEKIRHYQALLEEYQMIKGSALSLLNMNNNTKRRVIAKVRIAILGRSTGDNSFYA